MAPFFVPVIRGEFQDTYADYVSVRSHLLRSLTHFAFEVEGFTMIYIGYFLLTTHYEDQRFT